VSARPAIFAVTGQIGTDTATERLAPGAPAQPTTADFAAPRSATRRSIDRRRIGAHAGTGSARTHRMTAVGRGAGRRAAADAVDTIASCARGRAERA
jgi:hypothetical protein